MDALWRAVAAYLARFKRQSRVHTEPDLRAYLTGSHSLDHSAEICAMQPTEDESP